MNGRTDWVTNVRTTYYLIVSTGPAPVPGMVRDFQSVTDGKRCRSFARLM